MIESTGINIDCDRGTALAWVSLKSRSSRRWEPIPAV
jgi:hypothetical protein